MFIKHDMTDTATHYLAMWDVQGLECIFNVDQAKEEIDQWEKEKIVDLLKEQKSRSKPNPIPLQLLILRARMNSHRQYEIYEFTSTFSLTELKELFKTTPQPIVDWVRINGHKIYSDHMSKDEAWVIK